VSDRSSAFRYGDTAIGGVNHRNHPTALDAFHPPAGAVDVYTTAVRYDDGLLEHWRAHRNAAGHRTVAGYRGACTASGFFSDFDSAGDLSRALDDVRRFVRFLIYEEDVPAEAIRIVFSGRKGFHVEVPDSLFGGFEPDAALPARLGVLAEHWAQRAGITTLDLSVYRHLNLFRVPNTRNGTTGLYAIELTATEIQTLDADTIRQLARQPRRVDWLPATEFLPRPTLRELWQRTAAAARTQPPAVEREPGATVPQGKRHPYLISLNAALERKGVSAAGRRAMLRAANATELAEPLDDAEIGQIAAHAHPDGDREDWSGDDDQPPEPFDQADRIATLERDLEDTRAKLARTEHYNETLLRELATANQVIHGCEMILSSAIHDQQIKAPYCRLLIARAYDPRFQHADTETVPIWIDQIAELNGGADDKTVRKWLQTMEAENLGRLTHLPGRKRPLPNGHTYQTKRLALQIGPRPGEAPLTLADYKRLMCNPTGPARRKVRTKAEPIVCPKGPEDELRREWYCTVHGDHVGTDYHQPRHHALSQRKVSPATEGKGGKLSPAEIVATPPNVTAFANQRKLSADSAPEAGPPPEWLADHAAGGDA
jgi:hypothetical protein